MVYCSRPGANSRFEASACSHVIIWPELGGHAAEDARHRGVGAPFGLVVGLVLADRFEQQIVLNLIRIATRPVVLPDQIRGCLLVAFVDSRFRDSFAENG